MRQCSRDGSPPKRRVRAMAVESLSAVGGAAVEDDACTPRTALVDGASGRLRGGTTARRNKSQLPLLRDTHSAETARALRLVNG